jgi:hypothetical protein
MTGIMGLLKRTALGGGVMRSWRYSTKDLMFNYCSKLEQS